MKASALISGLSQVISLALAQQCQAAGHVTSGTEAALDTAFSGGGKVIYAPQS